MLKILLLQNNIIAIIKRKKKTMKKQKTNVEESRSKEITILRKSSTEKCF